MREVIKASSEHESTFRSTWKLREEFSKDPEWMAAYEYAATHKLYSDEISAIGEVLERRE